MTRHTLVALLAVVLVATLGAGTSQAQGVIVRVERPPRAEQSRIFIDVNVSGQAGALGGAREFTSRFIRFAEVASMRASYSAPRHELSPLVDVAGTFMLKRFLGVGASYSRVTYVSRADVGATIPHPTFYAFPATASLATDRDLERVEAATNLFVALSLIRTNQVQLRILGGPSFFSYRADMVQDVSYLQVSTASLPQNSITVDGFSSARASARDVGLHAGGDVAYFFSRLVGVTAGVRFSSALVTLDPEPLSQISQQIRIGGTVVFVGARVRLGD